MMRRPSVRFRGDVLFVDSWLGNTGDRLIREGCIRFLRDEGLDPAVSDGVIETAARAHDTEALLASIGAFEGIVVFCGGGNLGIYLDNMLIRERVIHAAGAARGFLVMPQSGPHPEAALRDPRVTVWARDAVTHDLLTQRGLRTRLVPDASFVMADTLPRVAGDPRSTFVIRRSEGRCQERVPLWTIPAEASGDVTFDLPLDDVVATLAPHGTVLSDRLHGAVIALMMGKRTGIMPVGYHKNAAYAATWLDGIPGVRFLPTLDAVREFRDSDETPPPIDWRERFADVARPALREFLRGVRGSPRTWVRGLSSPRRRPTVMAVSMVKNEQDIVEPFVRQLAPLVDVLAVIDNASVDGTREILSRLAGEFGNLMVTDSDEFAYNQSERMTAFVSQLQGIVRADFVLPLDVDEFLPVADRDALERLLGDIPVGGVGLLPWVTHVIVTDDDTGTADPPRTIPHHRREEERQFFKVAIRLDGDPHFAVTITQGNHDVVREEHEVPRVTLDVGLRHFPVRSREQIAAKAIVGWAACVARDPGARLQPLSYQWREVNDVVASRGVAGIPLRDVSLTYAQSPDAAGVAVGDDGLEWSYVRRYSDGAAGDPFTIVARSWERSLGHAPTRVGEWMTGSRHASPLADDRAGVRAVVEGAGAREAVYLGTVPQWLPDQAGRASAVEELGPTGHGCVICVWQGHGAASVAVPDAVTARNDVRAVVVVPPEAMTGGVPVGDLRSPVPGHVVDVAATVALRALSASDVVRRGAQVLVVGRPERDRGLVRAVGRRSG